MQLEVKLLLTTVELVVCFNSILVQLEGSKTRLVGGGEMSFNSILVQLEVSAFLGIKGALFCFNSILVQLEAPPRYSGR